MRCVHEVTAAVPILAYFKADDGAILFMCGESLSGAVILFVGAFTGTDIGVREWSCAQRQEQDNCKRANLDP